MADSEGSTKEVDKLLELKEELEEKKEELNVVKEELEDKEAELEEKSDRISELEDLVKKIQADFENYKKRTEKKIKSKINKSEKEYTKDLLEVLDAFKSALDTEADMNSDFLEGIRNTHDLLVEKLRDRGLREIETEEFDPKKHRAISKEHSEQHEDGEIIEVLQRGYLFKKQVLRPAVVKVAKSSNNSS
ncbi:MAG: Molecular chaperone GrpE [Candidatus Methanohalarchaeum thermophilum]|uniref:Protein GrpE n=1 Tax=Methanohalarchaeum thermophilum TaxID=1903181 RepID=A0A1Q6DWB0_METT1|nr:MAG: Molecular chaperone GrpE [Candidatus Methanohalarchaeum thermophilum]